MVGLCVPPMMIECQVKMRVSGCLEFILLVYKSGYLEIGLVDFLYRAKEIVNSDKARWLYNCRLQLIS